MGGAGELTCARHLKPTRITCVTCDTPICPECAIRTQVGLKCPEHASKPAPAKGNRFGAVVVILAVVGIVGFTQLARTTGRGDPGTPPCPTETAPDVGIGSEGGSHWKEMSPAGLCGRYGASTAWTGTQFLIWGGTSCAGAACPTERAPHLSDGAAYTPAKNAWRKLPASPLVGREGAATAWTGTELLIWGGTDGDFLRADGAAYRPSSDSWRPLAAAGLDARSWPASVWTGKELLVWGGGDRADGAAYDPATDRWRPLAAGPLSARTAPIGAWTGREMLVWGGGLQADGAAYDPASDRWRTLANSPLRGRAGAASAWTGRELVVWGGSRETGAFLADGAAYDPATDRWRLLSRAPVTGRAAPAAVWSGREMLIWGGIADPEAADSGPLDRVLERRSRFAPVDDGAAYDPATDRWRPLEPVPLLGRGLPMAVWDGESMLLWGGLVVVSSPASSSEGVRYTP